MKSKKIIALIILLLGIIMITFGIINFSSKNNNIDNSSQEDLKIKITNFRVNMNNNIVNLSFNISNDEKPLKEQPLKLNFYENDNIVYVYEYSIDELETFAEIKVEANLEFEYKEITKYEFVINNTKFKWFGMAELEKNPEIMQINGDIIGFIKEWFTK